MIKGYELKVGEKYFEIEEKVDVEKALKHLIDIDHQEYTVISDDKGTVVIFHKPTPDETVTSLKNSLKENISSISLN